MPVSFERIPANIRVPLFYAEISAREAAYFQQLQPTLLIGSKLAAAPAIINEPILVSDASQAAGLFGAGSVLADMVSYYRRNDVVGTLWCIPHDAPAGAVAANLTDTIAGTAAASGSVALYIAGDRYAVTIAQGNTGPQIAARMAALINGDAFALVTADAPPPSGGGTDGTITYTAKTAGVIGNEIMRAWNWRGLSGGEYIPSGITITGESNTPLIAPLASGAGAPDLAATIAAMGDDEYDFICTPYTDTASLDLLTAEMNDVSGRWAWSRQIYGHVFGAKMGTPASLQTFGLTRNDPHTSILGFAESPTVSWRRAASLTGQAASSLRIDPARPLQTLVMVGVQPPARGKRFKLADNNTLLYSGVATEMEAGGAAAIQRVVTNYRVNAWNQPDPSWLDVQTPATLAYIIRFMRQRIMQKFGRHKLADDGTPFGYGQAIVTPRIIRAELVAAYSELISMGIAENMPAFKAYLIVERDPNDPNRINVLLPPDLINQLRIFAMLVEFRLQSSSAAGTGAGGIVAPALAPQAAPPPVAA
jgi:phage tail sheath gpL-like